MTPKFKTGDYVFTCKPTFSLFEEIWTSFMDQFDGKKGRIENIITKSDSFCYQIRHEGEKEMWKYSEEWLKRTAPASSSEQTILPQYCPVCGMKGFLGFNIFHCTNKDCSNYQK